MSPADTRSETHVIFADQFLFVVFIARENNSTNYTMLSFFYILLFVSSVLELFLPISFFTMLAVYDTHDLLRSGTAIEGQLYCSVAIRANVKYHF